MEITGKHVLIGFLLSFGTLIAVNMTLAVNAVRTFPGLEVKNSYVAGQGFEASRAAQAALGWETELAYDSGNVLLNFNDDSGPVQPQIEEAFLGYATNKSSDIPVEFNWNGEGFVAPLELSPGNWNLRIRARADDGTLYSSRLFLRVRP